MLAKCRQIKNENVALYAERLLGFAQDSFPEGIYEDAVQRQLVNFFTDGLQDQSIKVKILRAEVGNLEEAVKIASKEQNVQRQVKIRFGTPTMSQMIKESQHEQHEPMDISAVRGMRCFNCKTTGHKAVHCPKRNVREIQIERRCWSCGRPGHISRYCWVGNHQEN